MYSKTKSENFNEFFFGKNSELAPAFDAGVCDCTCVCACQCACHCDCHCDCDCYCNCYSDNDSSNSGKLSNSSNSKSGNDGCSQFFIGFGKVLGVIFLIMILVSMCQ